MAKENKSTTILLLVIAGVLLFLVGSFTGQAFTWFSRGEGQACYYDAYCQKGLKCVDRVCTKVTETTQQKQDVLNILHDDAYTSPWAKIEIGHSGIFYFKKGDLPFGLVQDGIDFEIKLNQASSDNIVIQVNGISEVVSFMDTRTVNGIEITNLGTYRTIINKIV